MYQIEVSAPINFQSFLLDKKNFPKEFQIGYKTNRSLDASQVVLIVTFLGGIPITVIGNRLYDLIYKHSKGQTEKVTIDRGEIVFSKGEIVKVIEEHVESQKEQKPE